MTELHVWPNDNIFVVYHFGNGTTKRVSLLTYEAELTFVDDHANNGYGLDLGSVHQDK